MSTAALCAEAAEGLLQQACARNVPLELHFQDPRSRRLIIGRTRALGITQDAILADTPQYRDDDGPIPTGRPVSAHFMLGDKRFGFKTVIERVGVRIRPNQHQGVRGIALRRPSTVKPVQRRTHYRVRLVGSQYNKVALTQAHPKLPDACPLYGCIGVARLINLSAGGAGVVLESSERSAAQRGDHLYLTFTLPGIDGDLCMLGIVRYVSSVRSGESVRLGIEFTPWGGNDFDRCRRRITQSVTELERQALRRKK
ncbi:MAG: PilZ domain-containing protein [Planctomycetes bacterium]|nr:PilZ domain-containing protein [Planctomycetota bacterium]